MPDIVRAKLHKMTGYVLRDADNCRSAAAPATRDAVRPGIGVKKDIERLERALKPNPNPQR
jgi:hypothetical protein